MPISLDTPIPPNKTITFFFSGVKGPSTTDADLRRAIPAAFAGTFFQVESVNVNSFSGLISNSLTGHFVDLAGGHSNPAGVDYILADAILIINNRLESVDGYYLATVDSAEWGSQAPSWIDFIATEFGISPGWIYFGLVLIVLLVLGLFISDVARVAGR